MSQLKGRIETVNATGTAYFDASMKTAYEVGKDVAISKGIGAAAGAAAEARWFSRLWRWLRRSGQTAESACPIVVTSTVWGKHPLQRGIDIENALATTD